MKRQFYIRFSDNFRENVAMEKFLNNTCSANKWDNQII